MILDRTSLQAGLGAPQERVRLVRLCTRLTGDRTAAEDLAQETLVEAWRHLDALRRPDALSSWLDGIAANVCRRWRRRVAVEATRMTSLADMEDLPASPGDEALDRRELAVLLDRAMTHLTPMDREVLGARYLEERSLAEIAARGGWTVNTAAVRLGRSRKALLVVLTTHLRADAAEFGLIPSGSAEWERTRLWCFRCGRERLEGQFNARAATLGTDPSFAVRCPQCDMGPGEVAFSSAHPALDAALVLGQTRSYKPAFRRINAWWDDQIQRGLRRRVWECWRCSGTMILQPPVRACASGTLLGSRALFRCGSCVAEFSLPPTGLAFHSAAGQHFWQRHPRMRAAPERAVFCSEQPAIVARFEDVTSSAYLEIAYAIATFQPIRTWDGVQGGTDL